MISLDWMLIRDRRRRKPRLPAFGAGPAATSAAESVDSPDDGRMAPFPLMAMQMREQAAD